MRKESQCILLNRDPVQRDPAMQDINEPRAIVVVESFQRDFDPGPGDRETPGGTKRFPACLFYGESARTSRATC